MKKAIAGPGLMMVMLQALFMDRFWYSPGMDSFPAIYIRGGSGGTRYDPEDIDEGKGSLYFGIGREFRVLALFSAHDDILSSTHSFGSD